jgi:hypothetical protein
MLLPDALETPLIDIAPRVGVSTRALSTPLTWSHIHYVKPNSLLTCFLNQKQVKLIGP